jgi:hypothetical protein
MAQPDLALDPPKAAEPPADRVSAPADRASAKEALRLLCRAAQLAAEDGMESEDFMQAAWDSCLDARPGLRAELEDRELRSQLKKLRKRGLVAKA